MLGDRTHLGAARDSLGERQRLRPRRRPRPQPATLPAGLPDRVASGPRCWQRHPLRPTRALTGGVPRAAIAAGDVEVHATPTTSTACLPLPHRHSSTATPANHTAPPPGAAPMADGQGFDLYESMPPPQTVFRLGCVPLASLCHHGAA